MSISVDDKDHYNWKNKAYYQVKSLIMGSQKIHAWYLTFIRLDASVFESKKNVPIGLQIRGWQYFSQNILIFQPCT